MLSFKRLDPDEVDWSDLASQPGHTVCKSRAWLQFIAQCQSAEPVVAEISEAGGRIGYFVGAIIKKMGLKILGSPFPGWTTLYMGFNLPEDYPRAEVSSELVSFAFDQLGCVQVEAMDRFTSERDIARIKGDFRLLESFRIDLTQSTEDIWRNFKQKSARYSINKATKSGVTVTQCTDDSVAEEFHAQLVDVFEKQSLKPTFGVSRVKSLINNLLPDNNILLLRATDSDGTCVATGIFPGDNNLAYFWGGASWRQYQKLCPNELVVWQAVQYWKERGSLMLDFGGAGEYKRKYGGERVATPWWRKSKYPFLETLRKAARWLSDRRHRI